MKKADVIKIGRDKNFPESCQINDKRISTLHCTLIFENEELQLTDNSTNGTFVNKIKVGKGKTIQIKDNDEISLSSTGDIIGKNYLLIFRPSKLQSYF